MSIPVRAGPSILLVLDPSGRPRPGWPIAVKDTTACQRPLPISDGSVRIVCDANDLPRPDSGERDLRAFSFDADGRLMDGWPVQLSDGIAGMGAELTVVTERTVTDENTADLISHDATVTTVATDGVVRISPPLGLFETCCIGWGIGPDNAAYGVGRPQDGGGHSRITALEVSGVVSEWNLNVDGIGSSPAFGSGGKVMVAFGSDLRRATRVSVLTRSGGAVTSDALPLRTAARSEDTGGCNVGDPEPPVVSKNGTIFVYSDIETSIYALDPSLAIKRGWPLETDASRTTARPGLESEHEAGYCPTPLAPVTGLDGTLLVSLEAATSKVGGSLVAIGPAGRLRPGWPVGLKRPGAEFWSVAVGANGTVYAVAIEPEAGHKSSASILAIAPDSTVRWTTTIIDP